MVSRLSEFWFLMKSRMVFCCVVLMKSLSPFLEVESASQVKLIKNWLGALSDLHWATAWANRDILHQSWGWKCGKLEMWIKGREESLCHWRQAGIRAQQRWRQGRIWEPLWHWRWFHLLWCTIKQGELIPFLPLLPSWLKVENNLGIFSLSLSLPTGTDPCSPSPWDGFS